MWEAGEIELLTPNLSDICSIFYGYIYFLT